jgi:O-antigen ligase
MPGRRPIPRRWVIAGCVSALLAALLASELVGARLAEGIAEVRAYVANPGSPSARETSLGLRLLSWQWGWEQFLANPVFGIGLGNFRSAVAAAVAAGTLPPILTTFGGLHNLFIDHLTTTGLVGTVAMLAFWAGALGHFIVARRSRDADKRLFATWGLMLLMGELVFSNVGSLFASSLGTLCFCVLLAVFAAGAHPATPMRY